MRRITICFLFLAGVLCSFSNEPVEKGTISSVKMPCKLLQGVTERSYAVYLPPSYSTKSEKEYPVLYLLHGGGCSHTEWEHFGHIRAVADSLILIAKKIEEVIIVCPEGNENNMIWFDAPHWKYETFFFDEFMPFIESTYRISKERESRSIGGFSMGGGGSVVYGLHHPEIFSKVYGMSAYLYRQELEFLKNDSSAEWRQQLVEAHNPIKKMLDASQESINRWREIEWVLDCGDADFTFEANRSFAAAMSKQGIPYQFTIRDGGHDWNYWRGCIVRMLKSFY